MLARQYVWWPGIYKGVEDRVKACVTCQESHKAPPQAPLHPWEWPEKPWERIHADYAGSFTGSMILIIINAHLIWMEVYPTGSSLSQITMEKIRLCFASLGIPKQLVTDNGPYFISKNSKQFIRKEKKRKTAYSYVTSSPVIKWTSGKAVQTSSVKKLTEGKTSIKVSRFLIAYHSSPRLSKVS